MKSSKYLSISFALSLSLFQLPICAQESSTISVLSSDGTSTNTTIHGGAGAPAIGFLSNNPSTPMTIVQPSPSGRYLIRLRGESTSVGLKKIREKIGTGQISQASASAALRKEAQVQNLRIQNQQLKLINQLTSKHLLQKTHARFSLLTNTLVASVAQPDLATVASLPEVESIFPDGEVRAVLTNSVPQTHAPEVWNLSDKNGVAVKGKGIKVAILDTGIDFTHPDLGGCVGPQCKVLLGQSFVAGTEKTDFMDRQGHGTHVAGIVAANGTLKGVAPEASLYAFKVLNDSGYGSDSSIIAALEKAADPDGDPATDDAADVINLSLGGAGSPQSPLSEAANNAVEAGIVVVVAAGNSGSDYYTIGSPGNAKKVLTVGAIDNNNKIAFFSSRGPVVDGDSIKPEIVAPGVDINSLKPGGQYVTLSGTSMATPHVAGGAALMRQLYPQLSPQQIKNLLMTTATDLGVDVMTQGVGAMNLLGAAQASVIVDSPLSFLGGVGLENNIWSTTKSVQITNLQSTELPLSIEKDTTKNVPGFSFQVSPTSTANIGPGQTLNINVDVSVDNSVLGFPTSASKHFETGFKIKTTGQVINNYLAATKSAQIRFVASKGLFYVAAFGHHPGVTAEAFNFKNCNGEPSDLILNLNPEVYDVVAVYCDSSTVFKENINLTSKVDLTITADDANLKLSIDKILDSEGNTVDKSRYPLQISQSVLTHGPSERAMYLYGSGDTFKMSPFSKSFGFSFGGLRYNLQESYTTNSHNLYFYKWSFPEGLSKSYNRNLDERELAHLTYQYSDPINEAKGLVSKFGISQINPSLGGFASGIAQAYATEKKGPMKIEIYADLSDLSHNEMVMNLSTQVLAGKNSFGWNDFVDVVETGDLIFPQKNSFSKLTSPFFPQNINVPVLQGDTMNIIGNGINWASGLKFGYGSFWDVNVGGFVTSSALSDSYYNIYRPAFSYKVYCDGSLVNSGVYGDGVDDWSPQVPSSNWQCNKVSIERSWDTQFLNKTSTSTANLTVNAAAQRNNSLPLIGSPILHSIQLKTDGKMSRVLDGLFSTVEIGLVDFNFISQTDVNALQLEIKVDEGAWEPLAVKKEGTLFYADLPVVAGEHWGSLHIVYKDSQGNVNEQTLNNIFKIGVNSGDHSGGNSSVPVFKKLADLVVEATGKSSNYQLPDVYARDLKDGLIKAIPNLSGPFAIGQYQIIWTATNTEGKSATAEQTLYVKDTTPPLVLAPAAIELLATGVKTEIALGTGTASDMVDGTLIPLPDFLGPFEVGSFVVHWYATDKAGNRGDAVQMVNVLAPAPTMPTLEDIQFEATGVLSAVPIPIVTANDLLDGELSASLLNPGPFVVGVHTLQWRVINSHGKIGIAYQTLRVVDTTPPKIIAPADINLTAESLPVSAALGQATATDVVDGVLQTSASQIGPFSEGSTTVVWTAKDAAGNVGTATQTVTVYKPAAKGGGGGGGGGAIDLQELLLLLLSVIVFTRVRIRNTAY